MGAGHATHGSVTPAESCPRFAVRGAGRRADPGRTAATCPRRCAARFHTSSRPVEAHSCAVITADSRV
jgi:hypothetical protein